MRYDQLTYIEIKELGKQHALVVLPTGCTEQQGPHLPVGFDTWFAHALSVAAAEKLAATTKNKAVVLPAPPFGPILDVDAHPFLAPGDMPDKIRQFCVDTGQAAPESKGAVLRCALESLALRYRWVLGKLEEMQGQTIEVVHIIGGGLQNELLCQLAADAMQRPVVTGPIEATAMGNILMQALALGEIASLDQGRELVRCSCEVKTYEPGPAAPWDEVYGRYIALVG